MITRLDIANYAIIESVSVDFSSNLNIITGETGSGKSILLGALNLILGERADTKVLYNRDKKCIVEGTFQVDRYDLRSFFERNDLDYDNEVVIRREIAASGKSRAFINDTPVKLKQVRDLCSRLVDLHQQFENFGINDQGYQLGMIDAVARVQELKASYQEHFRRWKSWLTTADELRLKQRSALQEKDFIQFQLTEFEDCDLDEKKDSGLEERMQEMEHAEEIISGLAQISRRLEEEDTNVVGQLKDLLQSISQITKHHGGAASLFSRLDSVIIELQDIAIEANHLSSGTQHEPQKVAQLRNRLDQLNHLFHKHHVKTIAELLAIEHDLTLQIETFENLDEEIARVSTEIRACETAMTQIAENLTKERQKTIKPFASKVNALLHELKMEHANFKISLTSHGTFLPDGKDQIEFLFAPNKGSDHFPIKQVASGGELSRLSLITKSLVAKSLSLPTLVFDEVDSGISGDIALRMGQILREMADDHQIICITHTPQVAAKATKHLKVTKQSQGQVTKTKIEVLQSEESIYEIATMLSSSPPSKSAIASATELVYS